MKKYLSETNCKRCEGSGREPDLDSIEKKLKDSGLSQKDLAKKLDMSQQVLCDLLKGRRYWRPEFLKRLTDLEL